MLSEAVWNFGDIDPNLTYDHTFVLTNDTDHDVTIIKTATSCGCTIANVSKTLIKPGESTGVQVRIYYQGKSGQSMSSVSLLTDDPNYSHVTATVTGFVLKFGGIYPSYISFKETSPNSVSSRVVISSAINAPTFTITKIECTNNLSATLFHDDTQNHEYAVMFKPPNIGRFSGSVTFYTDSLRLPEIVLPVNAEITGQLIPSPNSVLLTPSPTTASRLAVKVQVIGGGRISATISGCHAEITSIEQPQQDGLAKIWLLGRYKKADMENGILRVSRGSDTVSIQIILMPFN
jgi:hypothetical protein